MNFRCVLIVLGFCLYGGAAVRTIRWATPNPNRPMTLKKLKLECVAYGWPHCSGNLTQLLDASSPVNTARKDCMAKAASLTIKVDPLSSINKDSDNTVSSAYKIDTDLEQGLEDQSKIDTILPEQGLQNQVCSSTELKSEVKKKYCDRLFGVSYLFINNIMKNDRENSGLQGLANCWVNNSYSSATGQYLSPTGIVTSITKWYRKMVNRHTCCAMSFPELVDYVPSKHLITCRHHFYDTRRWDLLLSETAVIMAEIEHFRTMHMRRICRKGCDCDSGCVSKEHLKCNFLYKLKK